MKRKIIEKPWGFEHIWAETDDYVAKMLHVKPNQVHRFGAGKEFVRLMEVSTPHLDDVVRLADDYNR